MTGGDGIVLALSGGAVRGIAHIAVLEVLEEEGIPVDGIAGTSAGSIVGALYAAGMSTGEIRRLALETKWRSLLRPTVPKKAFFSGRMLRSFMIDVLPVKRFESLVVPFVAVATDLATGEKVSLSRGSIARAVQASSSLPFLFEPVVIGGRTLVDGGVASMLPVEAAREEMGAGKLVAVNVNEKQGVSGRLDSLFQIASQLTYLYATRNAAVEGRLADVLVGVNTAGIALYDLSRADELLKRGRAAAVKALPEIRRLVGR